MTKKELKEKYQGKVICVTYRMMLGSFNAQKEVSEKVFYLGNCCKELGLRVNQLPEHAVMGMPRKLLLITDLGKPLSYSSKAQEPIAIEEFLQDFDNWYNNDKEREKEIEDELQEVREVLKEFNIKCDTIEKRSDYFTSKQANEEGFIQGYTSNEASLWWHPKGDMILFVRGQGAFTLK